MRFRCFWLALIALCACNRPLHLPAIEELVAGTYVNPEVAIAADKINTVEISRINVKVSLYDSYLELFDPDNFNCGFDLKLKKKLKNIRRDGRDSLGFIPEALLTAGFLKDSAYFFKGKGATYLTHGFAYKKVSGGFSDLKYALDAPTAQDDFDVKRLLDTRSDGANNFSYTCDCSGYLSAGLSLTGSGGFLGIGKIDIQSEASSASNTSKSIAVYGGQVYNAIHAAFRGKRLFSGKDSITYVTRLQVLESLFNELPGNVTDQDVIRVTQEYLAVFASNLGDKGFNGSANLKVESGFALGVGNLSGKVASGGTIARLSSYRNYNTYVIDEGQPPQTEDFTVQEIRDSIAVLRRLSS